MDKVWKILGGNLMFPVNGMRMVATEKFKLQV
jgi:hypothetical protein